MQRRQLSTGPYKPRNNLLSIQYLHSSPKQPTLAESPDYFQETAQVICPKCQHERTAYDTEVMAGVCPKCGIAYNKWRPSRTEAATVIATTEAELETAVEKRLEELHKETFWQWLYRYACFMPRGRDESTFRVHVVMYMFFVIWGLRFIVGGIEYTSIGGSFLHLVNLPFHEFGHVIFSPFGTYMMFLGGSLFQIMLPLLPMFAFMVTQRDNFAASIMLWWVGQNFIDVSVYIADAPSRALPLINGNEDSHDWWNLLSMSGSLDSAGTYANLCFLLGMLIILLSNAWGGHLLWIEFKGRTDPEFTSAE